ncbi:MAG TPA: AsmA-like C-terminal region-containing protein [Roseiarcus sp.]|nr:AsmA-like C-terminal region-containing protein [Roseiarcus sp.]
MALTIVAAGFTPWPLSPVRIAERLNAGGDVPRRLVWEAPQAAIFRALPWPNLRIVDARLDDMRGVNLISAPAARIDLSLLGLLSGRFAPEEATLAAPTMTLDLDRPPFAVKGRLTNAAIMAFALAPLANLSLSDGVMRVTSKARGFDTVIEDVQGALHGLAPGSHLRVNLSAVWRGAPVAIFLSLSDPVLAARGAPSAFSAALSSPAGALLFNGSLAAGPRFDLAGELSASSTSLAALARLLGSSLPPFLAADDLRVVGRIKATPTGVTVDEATATSAGQTVRGALQLSRLRARPSVSATLDSEKIAVSALLGPLPPLSGPNGEWSGRPFAAVPPGNFDLDLRLSARDLDLYGHELADVAAAAILKDGVLTASLVDSAAYSGRLKGELRFACDERSLRLDAQGELADADFGAAFSDFGWPVITGKGTAAFAVHTAGRSPASAAAELGGSARLKLEHGGVMGFNLEQLLRRSQRRPIDVTRDMRIGETAFDRLSLELALGEGVAHVVNGGLLAPGVAADLQGAIDLAARSWSLRLNAAQTDAAGAESEDSAHLSLDIEGPWSQPAIAASGAADAVPTAAPPSPAR